MTTFHLVQTTLQWEDAAANRAHLTNRIQNCHSGVIVLPEMFSTGFSMASRQLAETMTGDTVNWMQDTAGRTNSVVCGSAIIHEENHYYNRFLWVTREGVVNWYDKRHLFRMADEHDYYSAGHRRIQVEADGMLVLPQVCYDLRFPAWSRNYSADAPYDVLLYVANWPAARRDQWLTLLKARAIENLSYVIAVNRIGIDGNGVNYCGDSCVIDYRGDVLQTLGDTDLTKTVSLDLAALREYRQSFPAYLDADHFSFET